MSAPVLYPAIDVREGRVVRLRQGDYARETRYPGSPLELAKAWAAEGARWLHLVDLDAARSGGYGLVALLAAIARETSLRVQTGGGVREAADVRRLLEAGAERVVVGSVAVREPERTVGWLRRFGAERIVIALDGRREDEGSWRLPVHGWTEASGAALEPVLAHYASAGARHLLCTDIDRDGMLAGPSLGFYRELAAGWPMFRLQASGGVRDAADIAAAHAAGCDGVVLGRALLEGRISLGGALAGTAAVAPC